jgi:hypothetical protein
MAGYPSDSGDCPSLACRTTARVYSPKDRGPSGPSSEPASAQASFPEGSRPGGPSGGGIPGNLIVSRHRGRKFLRIVGQQEKLLYHMADVGHRTSSGGLGVHNVAGWIAWLTAAYMIGDDNGTKNLFGTLKQAEVPPKEAIQLADHPLYIGDRFLETRPDARGVCDEDLSDESEESEPEGLISAPSRQPLRALRAET